MMPMTSVAVYGDSIMKGTVFDKNRYHSIIKDFFDNIADKYWVYVTNHAHFGFTSVRGKSQLDKDMESGMDCKYALLEFGGNDCNYDWMAIAKNPEGEHAPSVTLEQFTKNMSDMADSLRDAGVQPILMTLPPLDAKRFLHYVCKGDARAKENVLKWLGGDEHMIYRYQEMYSNAVLKLGIRKWLPVVDVRSRFLDRHDYRELLSDDGMHPSKEGYVLVYEAFDEFIAECRAAGYDLPKKAIYWANPEIPSMEQSV